MIDTSDFTRRKLIGLLGCGGAAAALPAAAMAGTAPRVPLEHGSADDWKRQVGSRFAVAGASAALAVVAVKPYRGRGSRPGGRRGSSFTVVFEAASGEAPAGDRIHMLRHESEGLVSLYLSPPSKTARPRLEAVFG